VAGGFGADAGASAGRSARGGRAERAQGGTAVRDPLGILESSPFLPSAAGLVSTRIGTRVDAVS
jgi:hypothetical protein